MVTSGSSAAHVPLGSVLLAPVLCATALAGQSAVRKQEAETAARVAALIKRLVGASKSDAAVAEAELVRIGKPAIQSLMKVARPSAVVQGTPAARRALVTLGRMGPPAGHLCDAFVEALANCDAKTFLPVLRVIADLVPYSSYAGDPRLAERLAFVNRPMIKRFSTGNDRQRFQFEFNRFQQRTQVDVKGGMPAMITELERNRTHRREVAAEVLGRLGPKAKKAIPALATALRKGAPVVGQIGGFSVPKYRDRYPRAACDAMVRIAPRDPRVAIAWAWQLENSASDELRVQAALRIAGFGSKAKDQVPDLIRALRDEHPRVRHEAITALGLFGPAATAAREPLQKIAAGKDRAAAARAKAALAQIGK